MNFIFLLKSYFVLKNLKEIIELLIEKVAAFNERTRDRNGCIAASFPTGHYYLFEF